MHYAILDRRGRCLWSTKFMATLGFEPDVLLADLAVPECKKLVAAAGMALLTPDRHTAQAEFAKGKFDISIQGVGDYLLVEARHPKWYVDLTRTEHEVCLLALRDFGQFEISRARGISPNTVQTHRRHILHKAGCRGIVGLTRWAIRQGIIEVDV